MRILWVSAVIVLIDQATKAAVLRLMHRGESIPIVGDWLRFTFTENPGMAFGIQAGPREVMTIFSIVVTVLVLWYLYSVRSGYTPYLVGLALILGGAVGNIIDRVFYAQILEYGSFFTGKVVDFIHVDLWRGYLPDALPLIGGHYTALFPIWNVADMSIVVGVVFILFFQRRFHQKAFEEGADGRRAASEAPSSEPSPGALPPQAPAAENTGAPREAVAQAPDVDGANRDGREDGRSSYAPPEQDGERQTADRPADG